MNSDHQKLSNTYELIYESNSEYSLHHTVELLINYDFECEAIDFDLKLDGEYLTNIMCDASPDSIQALAMKNIEKGIDDRLGEKIGVSLANNIKQPLLENVGYVLKEVTATSDGVRGREVSKVVIRGTYSITKAPVRI